MRDTLSLAVRLMVCALAAALLLAVVNAFTAGRIEENTRAKMNAARSEVIGDYEFADTGADVSGCEFITGIYRAMDGETAAGYVYELDTRGYGGSIFMCVGVSVDGAVTGVKVSAHVETKGLGTGDEQLFMARFSGLNAEAGAAAEVDGMTGATVSSTAVKKAVDEALAHYAENYAGEAVE